MWREHQSKQANPLLRAPSDSPSRSEQKPDPSRAQLPGGPARRPRLLPVLGEPRAFAQATLGQIYLQRLLAESPEKVGFGERVIS